MRAMEGHLWGASRAGPQVVDALILGRRGPLDKDLRRLRHARKPAPNRADARSGWRLPAG
jgi:hypothetical protein